MGVPAHHIPYSHGASRRAVWTGGCCSGRLPTPHPNPPPTPPPAPWPLCLQVPVQFKPGAKRDFAFHSLFHNSKRASFRRRIARRPDGAELVEATLPPGLHVSDGLNAFRRQRGVLFAEPNYRMYKASREEGRWQEGRLSALQSFWAAVRTRTAWWPPGGAAVEQLPPAITPPTSSIVLMLLTEHSLFRCIRFHAPSPTPTHSPPQAVVPNDPGWAEMWGMKGGWGSNAVSAWDTTVDCSDDYVGVVDEGIQYTHPDLAANVWTNPAETLNGEDSDGNGGPPGAGGQGWRWAGRAALGLGRQLGAMSLVG